MMPNDMIKCDNCKNEFSCHTGFALENFAESGMVKDLCSPSCLVEFAWKLKEGQEKLSKSNAQAPNP